MSIPTPHINAKKNDFAKTVIVAGDPLRAKYIAENFLHDVRLVSDVRNMFGYTGKYKNKRISVMGHGMGMPSMMIYAYELFNFYGVENIIRVGTSGGLTENAKIKDTFLATSAFTTSNIGQNFKVKQNVIDCSEELLCKAEKIISDKNLSVKKGRVATLDVFDVYCDVDKKKLRKKDCEIVEMETYILYLLAKKLNKNALSFLTVSDNPLYGECDLTAEERQTSLNNMIEVALELATKL